MAIAVGTSTTSTASTFAHNVSGANVVLIVAICGDNGSDPSSVTYNGVSMTKGVSRAITGANTVSIWYLGNPAAGSNNVVITGGGTLGAVAVNITGANTSSPVDGTASNYQANSAGPVTINRNVTTSQNNSIVICCYTQFIASLQIDGQNTADLYEGRGSSFQTWSHSYKTTTTAGSISTQAYLPGNGDYAWALMGVKEYVAAGPANIKTHNNLAQASVKTVNGLVTASIKTKNGLN